MTAHARLKSWLILQDCITALQMLGKAVDDPDGEKQVTVLWVAAVTMLRAVGHVLQKVDAANNPAVKRLLSEAWPSWQRAWQFQQSECYRNKTLKEYDFGWEHRVLPVWSAPHRKPEDDLNVRHYGLLTSKGDDSNVPRYQFRPLRGAAPNVLETLWQVWQWWMDRVAALGHLIGAEPLSDRQKTHDCFIGRARITRQVL